MTGMSANAIAERCGSTNILGIYKINIFCNIYIYIYIEREREREREKERKYLFTLDPGDGSLVIFSYI